jgi:hypothetical protein
MSSKQRDSETDKKKVTKTVVKQEGGRAKKSMSKAKKSKSGSKTTAKTSKAGSKKAKSTKSAKSNKSNKTSKAGKMRGGEKKNKRYFKMIDGDTGETIGRYTGNTPKQAGSKAFTKMLQRNKKEGINTKDANIFLRESTRGSYRKTYGYYASRNKLKEPQILEIPDDETGDIKTITYHYRNDVKKIPVPENMQGGAKKGSKSKAGSKSKSKAKSKSGSKSKKTGKGGKSTKKTTTKKSMKGGAVKSSAKSASAKGKSTKSKATTTAKKSKKSAGSKSAKSKA